MGSIEDALAAIYALKPGDSINYTQIAKKYGVVRSTLARRHQGVVTARTTKVKNQQTLHPQQEQELLRYIEQLTRQGLPPTRAMIRTFASQIAQKELGYHWVDRFVQRYPNNLISKWTTDMDNSRRKADSNTKYSLYFKLLRDKIDQYHVEARHIYNMDEKGFMLGVVSRSKRIFSRASYEARGRRSSIQDGNREWITLLACICADGSYLEPALIYQSTSGSIQDSWLQAFDTESHQARFSSSASGWTNNEIGLAWLKQVFDRNTKAKARSSYRLLILDGHGSHLTMDFINYCDQNKILLAVYPPHSTHTLQPLDVSLFKPLSTAYSNEISAFMERNQGLTSMSKRDFFPLFYRAWEASFKETTILNAFKTTGLSPFNPHVILQKFNTTTASSSDSDSLGLSASDWRKVRSLVQQVVNNQESRKVAELNQTIHKLSVQTTLVQHENTKLKEALINERTCRKRGKALLLEEPEDYHGGAVFWSPRRLREARDTQQLKEREEEQLQQQKAEGNRLREEAKEDKARAVQLRRQQRAEARLLREEQKALKATDQASRKAARKAAQRLKQAIKTSQKGKKRSLQPLIKAGSKNRVAVEPQVGEEPYGDTPGLPPIQSRRGRKIKLPAKYK